MRLSGYQLILLTALISGVSVFVNSIAVKGFDALAFAGLKNALVAVLLFTVIIAFYKRKEITALSKKQWRNLAVLGVVGGSIPFALFFYGLKATSAANASFIHKIMFVFVAILAVVFLKERLNKRQLLAVGGLMAGVFFLTGIPTKIDEGILFVLAATLFWSAENVLAKHFLESMSGTVVAFGRMFFGSLVLLGYLALTGGISSFATLTSDQWIWTTITAAFLLGYVLTWYNGLKTVDVSEATAILALGSVVTILMTSTAFTLQAAAGITLICISTVTLIAAGKRMVMTNAVRS